MTLRKFRLKPRKGDKPDPHEPMRIDLHYYDENPLPAGFFATYDGHGRDVSGRPTKQRLIVRNALPEPIWLPGGEMQWPAPAADLLPMDSLHSSECRPYHAPQHPPTIQIGGMALPAEMFKQAEQTDLEQAMTLDHTKISTGN